MELQNHNLEYNLIHSPEYVDISFRYIPLMPSKFLSAIGYPGQRSYWVPAVPFFFAIIRSCL